MGFTIGIPSLKLNKVGRQTKHCGDFGSVAAEALEERKGKDKDIDRARADQNVFEGFRTVEELMAYSDKHCEELKDASGRKLRNDAVRMCVTVIKPPAMFMNSIDRVFQKQFLDDSFDCLEKIIGKDNVKSKAYHFDEQGSHLHVFWEPMTKDGRLCAKEMHNLKFFSELNKKMPEHLRACGWPVDDCKAFDQAKFDAMSKEEQLAFLQEKQANTGIASKKYKSMQESAKKSYEKAIQEEFQPKIEELENKVQELKKTIEELQEQSVEPRISTERISFINWCLQHIKGVGEAVEKFCRDRYQKYIAEIEKNKAEKLKEISAAASDLDNMIASAGKSLKEKPLKKFELKENER